MHDYHVHSNYSDGSFLEMMVRASEEAGLNGIGFADHCNVSTRDSAVKARCLNGTTLDAMHERRRRAIKHLRSEASIEVYDAVELDYDPRDEAEIRQFLDDTPFDYAIGSVHSIDGRNVQRQEQFSRLGDNELDEVVNDYYETLVSLVDSELFEVAGHIDLVERNPVLRDRTTIDHYHRVENAFTASRTIPEINVGEALDNPGFVHPNREFRQVLDEHSISFTVGTDSHRPGDIGERVEFLTTFLADEGIEPNRPHSPE